MSTSEDRLADALQARAALVTASADLVAERRRQLHADAADDVVPVGAWDDEHGGGAPGGVVALDGARARRRRVVALVAAAAAAVLAAAAAGALLLVPGTGGAGPAARTAQQAFPLLTLPAGPDDQLAGVSAPAGAVPGAERRLLDTAEATYWLTRTTDGRACLVATAPEGAADSACGRPWRDDPLHLGADDGGAGPQVALVAAGAQEGALSEQGWAPLFDGLWASPGTARATAEADLRAASADTVVVGPEVGSGSWTTELTGPGDHAVLLRCLTAEPVVVLVDGAPQGEPLCGGRWAVPPTTLAAVLTAGSGGPATVSVQAPAGAAWAVAVVRCTPASRQCPSAPGGTAPG